MGFFKKLFGGMNDMSQGDDEGVEETMDGGEEISEEPMTEPEEESTDEEMM